MSDKSNPGAAQAPPSLASMQVDVTTRLGAPAPLTTTGFPSLDQMLGGGLRSGMLISLVSSPGVGRTTLALFIAYMAARSRANALFAAVGLDDTEVVARLTARALLRSRPQSATAYGAIWSGHALAGPVRSPLLEAVDTVVKKVGSHLHLYRAGNLEPTAVLADCAASLWSRRERVVLVVDDVEAFFASSDGSPGKQAAVNASLRNRVTQVAFDLKSIADQGCAVIATAGVQHAELVAPASTVVAELRRSPGNQPLEADAANTLELHILKNRLGPCGVVRMLALPSAGFIEELQGG